MISTAHKRQGENFCKKLCTQNTSHKKNEKKIFSTLPNSYYYILQISFKQLISYSLSIFPSDDVPSDLFAKKEYIWKSSTIHCR